MKKENKSLSVYLVAGMFAGMISFFIGNEQIALLIMVAIAAVLVKVLEKFLGKEKITWWIGNGIMIHVFVWIVSWAMLYNLFP